MDSVYFNPAARRAGSSSPACPQEDVRSFLRGIRDRAVCPSTTAPRQSFEQHGGGVQPHGRAVQRMTSCPLGEGLRSRRCPAQCAADSARGVGSDAPRPGRRTTSAAMPGQRATSPTPQVVRRTSSLAMPTAISTVHVCRGQSQAARQSSPGHDRQRHPVLLDVPLKCGAPVAQHAAAVVRSESPQPDIRAPMMVASPRLIVSPAASRSPSPLRSCEVARWYHQQPASPMAVSSKQGYMSPDGKMFTAVRVRGLGTSSSTPSMATSSVVRQASTCSSALSAAAPCATVSVAVAARQQPCTARAAQAPPVAAHVADVVMGHAAKGIAAALLRATRRQASSSLARWRDAASRTGSQVAGEPASAAQLEKYQLHRTRCDQVYSVLDTVAAAEERKIASLKRNLNVLLGLRHLHSWHVLQDFKLLKLALRKISDHAGYAGLGTSGPEALAASPAPSQKSVTGLSQSSNDVWMGLRTPRRAHDNPVITMDCQSRRTGIVEEYHYKWHGSLRIPPRGATSTSEP